MATPPPVTIMIVGAGLGGLLMGILCQRANIPYYIFERSHTAKPLGAVMSLNASILPVFEQLGLMDELMDISLPSSGLHLLNEDLEETVYMYLENIREIIGYDYIVFHRPRLYEILESKIDPARIFRGKKVLSISQNKLGVLIRTNDNQMHHGDILVGADGAYSAVRQALFKDLKKDGKLPPNDDTSLDTKFITLVGTTEALDPQVYQGVDDKVANFYQIIGRNKPYTWSTFNVPGNKICWSVQLQLDEASSKDLHFRNSEWGPERNADMIEKVRDFKTPYGATIGDLIDRTDGNLISKVLLEDKLFETWTSGRTVLIGDAAHKMLPSAGQGAVNAFLDGVVLINCLYELDNDFSYENIEKALKDFKKLRYEHVKEQYLHSKRNAKIQYGQKWTDNLARFLVFKVLPKSLQNKGIADAAKYRPQVAFLEFVPKRGSSPVLPQQQSKRFLREKTERERSGSEAATSGAQAI